MDKITKYNIEKENELMSEIIKKLDHLINTLSIDKIQLENQIKRIKKIREQQLELQRSLKNTFVFH